MNKTLNWRPLWVRLPNTLSAFRLNCILLFYFGIIKKCNVILFDEKKLYTTGEQNNTNT